MNYKHMHHIIFRFPLKPRITDTYSIGFMYNLYEVHIKRRGGRGGVGACAENNNDFVLKHLKLGCLVSETFI